jgi:transcriptional regulator with XRE-family HTH domain
MDKKQKEALVLALLEKGETYRDIARKAGVSPNTIKAIANKASLSEIASESSRAFELYVQEKTPIEVAIALNLEAEKAINYYHQYFALLGITEFTKAYLQVKDIIWSFINLVNLFQKARICEGEVLELLKIANGYLPRVRLEYDRLQQEINSTKAELNSWKAAVSNEVRVYQDFCNRNLALKNREDELQRNIEELEAKKTRLNKSLSEFEENDMNKENSNLEEEVTSMINILTQRPNMTADYPTLQGESKTIIFDTKDLFPTKAQT